jgi:hypothetical protein
MPEVVDRFPSPLRRNSKYEALYLQILDGQKWRLVRGVDFTCRADSFRRLLRRFTKMYGGVKFKSRKTVEDGVEVFYVQAFSDEPT